MTIEIDGNKLEYEFKVDEHAGERHVVIKSGRETKGDLVIPEMIDGCPVTAIGDFSFFCCAGLTSVKIPDGVTYVGHPAFRSCTGGLKRVTIPNGVTEIGSGAFLSCRSLVDITIPDSVTSIGENAFLDCTGGH